MTFSHLARVLGISRQTARQQALETAATGLVELFQAPDDRRAWQVALTSAGRRALDAQRMPPPAWLFTLVNALEPAAMRSTTDVLRIIRQRLERYERERRRISAASARR
jgi:DNA-binding MarR family transcriptional regulator